MRCVLKLVFVFVAVLSLMLAGAGVPRHFVAHAQSVASTTAHAPATPFCFDTSCDGHYENGGIANCSASESTFKSDTVKDAVNNTVGTLDLFVSDNNWCNSNWGGLHFASNVTFNGEQFTNSWCVGNFDVKDQCSGPSSTFGTGIWASTVMDEYDNSCISVWVTGYDKIGGVQHGFSHKLIYGGNGC